VHKHYFLAILSILGIILSLSSYKLSHSNGVANDIDKIKSALATDLDQVNTSLSDVSQFHFKENESLTNNLWYINILNGDSLIYWNQENRKQLERKGFEGEEIKLNEGHRCMLSPDIYTANNEIKPSIVKSLNLGNHLKLPESLSIHTIDSIDYLESITIRPNRYASAFRYIIFMLFVVLLLNIIYRTCRDMLNPIRSLVSNIALNIGLLTIFQLIDLSHYFEPLIVFDIIHGTSFWVSSLAEMILLIVSMSYIVIHLNQKAAKITLPNKYNPLSFLVSSLVLSSGLYYLCSIAAGIIRHPNIHLDIDNILLFDKYSLVVIVLLLAYLLLLFTGVCSIVNMAFAGNKSFKVLYYGVGIAIASIIYFWLNVHLPLWILITYMVVYLLMLDLFIEHRSSSIIWLIWWMVIFASFMAGIVFYNSLQQDIQERKSFVENLYQSADKKDNIQVSDVHQAVISSEVFSRLSQLRHGKLQRADLNEYLRQNIPFDQKLPNKKMQFECFDANQESLFNTYGIQYDQIKSQLDRSISINQFVKYNPYKQTYYLQYFVNNDFHENAPFELVIVLNPTEDEMRDGHDKHNYYVTQNDKIILMENRNTEELQLNEIAAIRSDTIINGYSFVTSQAAKGIKIINYKRISSLIKPISLFSYIFSILGLFIVMIGMVNSKWTFLSTPLNVQLSTRDSLRTKIQLAIIVLVVFSFLIRLQTKDIEYKGAPKTIVPLSINAKPPYAYITISFPESPRSYSSILDFISTILNVYVFLFLIAGAIALAIANSITRPLSVIADKLKAFKLGSSNEPLNYEDNDEIGQLINEYNNLIVQVQDSADIIAKTERDMAWREMAKQVAHEIKNPLTPMKLSIQYLDKMVKTNPDRAKDITEKVANTLVNQIDALSNIANEFSNYATMPKANNEKIILNEIVEAVHDLFRKRDDMEITMSEPIADLFVFVDRNQLLRILNNLVKNAIQAIPDERRGKIDIALQKKGHTAIITVQDNGKGIPDYMKQKVFTPNFTTKNSGTGLGLAISANMIDSMNGRIYFETEVEVGTTFFVEIPLVRSGQKKKLSGNRVSLDD